MSTQRFADGDVVVGVDGSQASKEALPTMPATCPRSFTARAALSGVPRSTIS
jgi:hypothetical protein